MSPVSELVYAAGGPGDKMPALSKLESLASSAVRSAGNTGADLIVVYTATGERSSRHLCYWPSIFFHVTQAGNKGADLIMCTKLQVSVISHPEHASPALTATTHYCKLHSKALILSFVPMVKLLAKAYT